MSKLSTKQAIKGLTDSSDELKARSAGMIFNMSADDDSREEIISLGGVELLCKLLKSNNNAVKTNSCGALINLSGDGLFLY
jgi:hypothetical protein